MDAVAADIFAGVAGDVAVQLVAVLQAIDRVGQLRIRRAMRLGLVVDGHRHIGRSDGQGAVLEDQGVVRSDFAIVEPDGALVDLVALGTHVFACFASEIAVVQHLVGGIAILKSLHTAVGQRRVGVAVDLGLVVGSYRQLGWGDGQGAVHAGHFVALLRERIATDAAGYAVLSNIGILRGCGDGCARADARAAEFPVDELIHLAYRLGIRVEILLLGQRRVGITVGARLVVHDNGQGCLA
ncbi:hypothetical protein D3C78_728970 [compost metagenome]